MASPINTDGELEVNTGGNNIIVNPNGSLSALKTTVSAADQKVSVTETGGFDANNNYTTNYAVGINISDRAFNALTCTGDGDGCLLYTSPSPRDS